jgi:aldehyde:ferredoxin oxidoreductase
MECWERGVITAKDTGGLDLSWGNGDALVKLTEQIGYREGFGDVLADGAKKAAERIDKGSEEWAIHIGGQDLPAHDPRVSSGYAWGYTTEATPARHTANQCKDGWDHGVPCSPVGLDKLISRHDDIMSLDNASDWAICSAIDRVWTSTGLCIFAYYPEGLPLVEAISALTGWDDFTIEEAVTAGLRIHALRQAFNFREGVDPSAWKLPKRLTVPHNEGPHKDKPVTVVEMKAKGYEALGWDPKTGKPLDETLKKLGLKELVG